MGAVGMQMGRDHTRLLRTREDHGTGAVAPEDAVTAVGVVGDARKGFGAHHQDVSALAAADELIRCGQGKHEPAADGLQIEGRTATHAQLGLQQACGAGKNLVRGGGGDQNHVQIGRAQTGGIERLARGVQRQIRGRLAGCRDVPNPDPGAIEDPLVGGIDHLLQIGIGQQALRQVASGTRDA